MTNRKNAVTKFCTRNKNFEDKKGRGRGCGLDKKQLQTIV